MASIDQRVLRGPLESAVDELYETFAEYRLHAYEPCADCYPPRVVERIGARLRTVPLRSLTLDDLSHFYADGVLTWGDVNDFRYLLPRLMELFAMLQLGHAEGWSGSRLQLSLDVDADLSMLRFVDADWRSWPKSERQAVDQSLFALWNALLSRRDDRPLPRGAWIEVDVLEAILRTTPTPDRYLAAWRETDWRGGRMLAWFISTDALGSWLIWEDERRPSTKVNWALVDEWIHTAATTAQLSMAAREAPAKIWMGAHSWLGNARPRPRGIGDHRRNMAARRDFGRTRRQLGSGPFVDSSAPATLHEGSLRDGSSSDIPAR